MFNLFKPGHVQLRNSLPADIAREYDEVLAMFMDSIPTYWSRGAQDRAITMVMVEWVMATAAAERLSIPENICQKAERFYDVCLTFNDRDFEHGGSSTALARDIVRALREAEIIPQED